MSSDPAAQAADDDLARARDFPFAVQAHPSAFVAPGAVVVGEVRLGERSSVWFGAVLRGDMDAISLGDESNVQDNSVIHVDRGHPTVVGRRVVIGHRALVHGAHVEDACLIGMGSILLTGSHIGTGSLVAAGALVGEGKRIPPRSLVVGVPGRVVGEVSDDMTAAIARGADHYVALSRTYRERGIGSALPPAAGPSVIERGLAPTDEGEIGRLLEALASMPDRLASRLAGPGDPAAREIVAEWLREQGVLWKPRLDRLLERPFPELPGAESAGGRTRAGPTDWPGAGERLARERAALVARLRELPLADWSRAGVALDGGLITVAEHVRRWAARDAGLLRRLESHLAAPENRR